MSSENDHDHDIEKARLADDVDETTSYASTEKAFQSDDDGLIEK